VGQVGARAGDRGYEIVYPLFRVVVGFLFACHGVSVLFSVLVPDEGGSSAVGAWPSWWAGLIELVGGVLVAVGLGTKVAAVLCSGTMAFAYFTVHQRMGALPIQNDGEPAAMFSWSFLLIAVSGPGNFSLDRLLRHRSPKAAETSPAEVESAH
jgi:putative oxidoreductase